MEASRIMAVIIDDEPGCVSYLSYCLSNYCPGIHVVGTGNSGNDLLSLVKRHSIDIAFLDIKIFDENIFDTIDKLRPINFQIVFVTAYDMYAVRAFRVNALDYLLKPLLKQEIISCYEKIKKTFFSEHQISTNGAINGVDTLKITIRTGDKILVIGQEDIVYLKANGPYTEIIFYYNSHLSKATVSKTIGLLEEEYSKLIFYRIHKSFLINISRVHEIIRKNIYFIRMDNSDVIPVAQRRVQDFLSHYKYLKNDT